MKNKLLKLGFAMVAGICLFLNQEPGLNLLLFGLLLSVLTLLPVCVEKIKNCKWELLMFAISLGSFAWYGDFISFAASWCAFFLFQLKLNFPSIQLFPGIILVMGNCIATPVRFWFFKKWDAFANMKESLKKAIYMVLIPMVFFVCFLVIYAIANDDLAKFLEQIKIDENIFKAIGIAFFVFLLLFNAWFLMIPPNFWQFNKLFGEVLTVKNSNHNPQNTQYFLRSGLVSFVVLSVLILIIIVLQGYETYKFSTQASTLSHNVHNGVSALIVSLLMAVGVILIYFNSQIEDTKLYKKMKFGAKIWLLLNGILVTLAFIQNVQYVQHYGFTSQRIGVFIFLVLSLAGLMLAYYKINTSKSNGFVVNRVLRLGLWTLTLSAPVNFSTLITCYNIHHTPEIDLDYLKYLEFNDEILNSYLKKNTSAKEYNEWRKRKEIMIKLRKNESFLSWKGYYKCVKF